MRTRCLEWLFLKQHCLSASAMHMDEQNAKMSAFRNFKNPVFAALFSPRIFFGDHLYLEEKIGDLQNARFAYCHRAFHDSCPHLEEN